MFTAAVAACAAACAAVDFACGRVALGRRAPVGDMDQGERLAVCRRILRHSHSAADLLGHWTPRHGRQGVEWFVARLLFGRESPEPLLGDPDFEECVREMSSLEAGAEAGAGEQGRSGEGGVAAPAFMSMRPVRHGAGVYLLAQRAVRSRATARLRRAGFEEMRHGDVRYWRGGAGGKPLAAFLHGIGVGLYPYVQLLTDLAETFEVVAIEFDHLTLSGGRQSMTNVQAAEAVEGVLRGRGAVLMGHSYGAVIAATINKRHPDLARGLVLLAPACFMLYRGEMQSRFFEPRAPVSQRVLRRNPTIHAAINAGTVWPQGEMWPEDVAGKRWLVALAEADQLIPFERTKKHVEAHFDLAAGERELMCLTGKHGSCMSSQREAVVARVRALFTPDVPRGRTERSTLSVP